MMTDKRHDTEAYKSKMTMAREALTRAILKGDYSSGQRFNIRQLAEELNMSVTPVREALRLLQAEGLVVYDEHRSVSAVELSEADTAEIYALRLLLEGMATEWAVENGSDEQLDLIAQAHEKMVRAVRSGDTAAAHRYNREWHFAIYRSSGTTFALEFISKLWARYQWHAIWQIPGRLETSVAAHEAITNAIVERDRDLAGKLLRQHVADGPVAIDQYRTLRRMQNLAGTAGENGHADQKLRKVKRRSQRSLDG
jgi:DNA-binding GntR family transcriptional regulator